jgi:amino acid transporter
MAEQQFLSLRSAILININIMLGAGIFLNTTRLSGPTGIASSCGYLLVGLLMFPLVLTIARLTNMYPSGGFYTFARSEISPFAGFMSAWSYLIAKLASGSLMLHFSLSLIQQLIPAFASIPILVLDIIAIALFVLLNTRNIQTGSQIQTAFTIFKLIPISFAILTGLYLLDGAHLTAPHRIWSGIPSILPFLVYAGMGFEAACLICNKMRNPERDAPRAIIISYSIVLCVAALYQFAFYGALGTQLADLASLKSSYLYAFPALLAKLLPTSPILAQKIQGILHLALASSALGGSYGIMFSNTWNLHTMASNNHVFFKKIFTWLNKHSIPVACVVLEGLVYTLYLYVSGGVQDTLQQLSVIGTVSAYTMSVIALLKAKIQRPSLAISPWIPFLGLCSCAIFITTALLGIIKSGPASLAVFVILLGLGATMFFVTSKKQTFN